MESTAELIERLEAENAKLKLELKNKDLEAKEWKDLANQLQSTLETSMALNKLHSKVVSSVIEEN